jgi:hypothetical protein
MPSLARYALSLALFALAAPLGCKDEIEPDPTPGLTGAEACTQLGELCHDVDTGTGLGAECHELGHVNDGDTCLARYDECKSFCESALSSGGSTGHSQGGGGGDSHDSAGGGSHGGAGGAH